MSSLEDEVEFTFARSSGPGGQNVNKVNSKVILRWNVNLSNKLDDNAKSRFLSLFQEKISADGDVVLSCDETRDQRRNKTICLEKLQQMLVQAKTRPKVRKKTAPTRASREKRLEQKARHSKRKQSRKIDF